MSISPVSRFFSKLLGRTCLHHLRPSFYSRDFQSLGPRLPLSLFPPPGLWLFPLGFPSSAHSLEPCLAPQGEDALAHSTFPCPLLSPGNGQPASGLEPEGSLARQAQHWGRGGQWGEMRAGPSLMSGRLTRTLEGHLFSLPKEYPFSCLLLTAP